MAIVAIVDGHPAVRTFLCRLLTGQGHRVLQAATAEAALLGCRAEPPDLIIGDLLMPGMDGNELVRQLRNAMGSTKAPIIYFTELPDAREVRLMALQLGVQQVLRKPSAPEAVLQAVNSALSTLTPDAIHGEADIEQQGTRALVERLLRNVDELETVNSRLASSERQYREMFEGHPEAMWVVDACTLRVLSVNDSAIIRYGYSREEFLALSIFDVLPLGEFEAAITRFQATDCVGELFRHRRKDGSAIEVELTTHKLEFNGRQAYSVLARDVTGRSQHEELLGQSEEQLQHLASHLQQLREKERAFLARELHDDMGQSLAALRMHLSWLAAHPEVDAKTIAARTAGAMALADRTIEATSRLASKIRPGILDFGLSAAVEWQIEEFRHQADIRCELDLCPDEIPLSADQQVTLFRIFEETLTNVARHSGASLVSTRLNVEKGRVVMAVQDNGRGITPEELAKRSSLGLLDIREQVRSLGGSIEITGRPGMGTLVSISVPAWQKAAKAS